MHEAALVADAFSASLVDVMAPPLESTIQVPSEDPKKNEEKAGKNENETQKQVAKVDGKDKATPEKDEMVSVTNQPCMPCLLIKSY